MADPNQSTRMTRPAALALLGLSEPASAREVTRAYRRLAKTSHPDLTGQPDRGHLPEPGSHEAGHRFASLADAYLALTTTPANPSTPATPATPPPAQRPADRRPTPVTVRVKPTPTRPPIIAGPVRITPSPTSPAPPPTPRRSP